MCLLNCLLIGAIGSLQLLPFFSRSLPMNLRSLPMNLRSLPMDLFRQSRYVMRIPIWSAKYCTVRLCTEAPTTISLSTPLCKGHNCLIVQHNFTYLWWACQPIIEPISHSASHSISQPVSYSAITYELYARDSVLRTSDTSETKWTLPHPTAWWRNRQSDGP